MTFPSPVARRSAAVQWAVPLLTAAVVGVVFVEALRRSDLLVFLRAAGDVVRGHNPYTPLDAPYLWHGSAYVYPYLTSFLFVPLTLVPVTVADVAWFGLSAGALVLGCRLLGLRDPLAVSAVLLSSTCIRSFQVGALNLLLFLAAALLWRYRERAAVVAVAFTLLAGSKLFLLPVVVWVVLTRGRRTAAAAVGALGLYLGLGLLLEPISVGQFLDSMGVLAAHEGPGSMSVLGWLSGALPAAVAKVLPLVIGAAILGAAVVYRLRRPGPGDAVLFGASIVASLVATPIYWSHYSVLVAVVVLVASPTRRAAVLFCAASWLVSSPALVVPLLPVAMPVRQLLLYGGMAVALAVLVVRAEQRVSVPAEAV